MGRLKKCSHTINMTNGKVLFILGATAKQVSCRDSGEGERTGIRLGTRGARGGKQDQATDRMGSWPGSRNRVQLHSQAHEVWWDLQLWL